MERVADRCSELRALIPNCCCGLGKEGERKGQYVLTVPVLDDTKEVRPPRWVTSELLQLERVSEKALFPLLGSSTGGDASVVLAGGDDTTEQQDGGDGGTEDPEEGVHWRLVVVLMVGLGARGVVSMEGQSTTSTARSSHHG